MARVDHWCDWLDRLNAGVLDDAQMVALTGGRRGEDDTFHILVMDLHKSLNRMAAEMSDDIVDGAHVLAARCRRPPPGRRVHARAEPHAEAQTRPSRPRHRGDLGTERGCSSRMTSAPTTRMCW
ncbi:hypothetical protein ACVOMV_07400 [Mesorhizobium atlanticum]